MPRALSGCLLGIARPSCPPSEWVLGAVQAGPGEGLLLSGHGQGLSLPALVSAPNVLREPPAPFHVQPSLGSMAEALLSRS